MANRQFPAIRIISVLLRLQAVLLAIGIFASLAYFLYTFEVKQQTDKITIAVAVGCAGYFLIQVIGLFALAELLTCFVAIEENTRQSKSALVTLQSVVRTSIEEQTQLLRQLGTPTAAPQNACVCTQCGTRLRITENMRGQKANCPKCGAQITIP